MNNSEKILFLIIKFLIIVLLFFIYINYSSYKDTNYYYSLYLQEKEKNDNLESKNISLKDELENIKIDVNDLEEEISTLKRR